MIIWLLESLLRLQIWASDFEDPDLQDQCL